MRACRAVLTWRACALVVVFAVCLPVLILVPAHNAADTRRRRARVVVKQPTRNDRRVVLRGLMCVIRPVAETHGAGGRPGQHERRSVQVGRVGDVGSLMAGRADRTRDVAERVVPVAPGNTSVTGNCSGGDVRRLVGGVRLAASCAVDACGRAERVGAWAPDLGRGGWRLVVWRSAGRC